MTDHQSRSLVTSTTRSFMQLANPSFILTRSSTIVSELQTPPPPTIPTTPVENYHRLIETARFDINEISERLVETTFRFRLAVDQQYSGIDCVKAHRTSCYQAFTFIEKRSNDRIAQCKRLLHETTEESCTCSQFTTCTSNFERLVYALRGIQPMLKWLTFALALYQYRDGIPYMQLMQSNTPSVRFINDQNENENENQNQNENQNAMNVVDLVV